MAATLYIRQWRQFRGMKIEAVAADSGLSRAAVGNIETGRYGYTRDSLEAIAQALSTHPGYLLLYNPNENPRFWTAWLALNDRRRRYMQVRLRRQALLMIAADQRS